MFRKNTAGQFIGFQLLLTATGAIATGLSPTVRRCIDGTFAAGGGTVTEDTGTGGYKYAMSQADTNGNDIQFWFSATGAIPVCVNIVTTAADPTDAVRFGFTSLPSAAAGATGGLPLGVDNSGRVDVLKINGTSQTALDVSASASAIKTQTDKLTFTVPNQIDSNVLDWKSVTAPAMTGDAYARLGAPIGASISVDVAGVQTDTTNIKTRIPAALTGGKMESNIGSVTAGAIAAAAFAANALDAVWSTTIRLLTAGTNIVLAKGTGITGLNDLDAAGIRTAAGLATANLDTQLSAIDSKTTNLPSDPADESLIITATDAIMTRIGAAGAGLTAIGDARLANLDVAVSTRLATSSYAAPDNADIALIKAKTDNLPAAPAAVGDIPTAIQNADTLLNRDLSTGTDSGSATVRTARSALQFLRNKWTIIGGVLTVYSQDDSTVAWDGVVTTQAGADPVVGSDPASS